MPWKQEEPEDEDGWYVQTFGVGTASVSLFPREVTAAEKKLWRKEDAARDARKIPIGFRP